MTYKSIPSQQYLKEIFTYDSEGYLLWNKGRVGRVEVGKKAGSSAYQNNRSMVCINYERYMINRLIFAYHYGSEGLQEYHIHHKDGDMTNNRIENLQKLLVEEHKREHRKEYYTKKKGVWYDKRRNKYCAAISYKGKQQRLGDYDTEEEALSARREAVETFISY